ncbi:MAG: L,D-transpeptidase [Stigonema ocellatum SAG 48.90 = DSM 106950]|nr:L,D-transpeptidase [Stigonema ocellatum SAG 48.90 = DSM 106950]
MKSLISRKWVRPLKLLLTGAVLSLIIVNAAVSEVWANSTSQMIQQQMQALQQSNQRWIQINLTTQRLTAWEGGTPVYAVMISSGKKSTPTLTGVFNIQSKHKVARMQGEDYDISNVPYAMYYQGNYAIHGAYWHRKFGTQITHGCVNVAPDHAKWLFQWASLGTPVIVHR